MENFSEAVQPGVVGECGYDHTTHGLRVRLDPNATRAVSLTMSSAMHASANSRGDLEGGVLGPLLLVERFAGDAPTDVTIQGSEITATVAGSDRLGNQGWPITSDAAAVDGRFACAGNAAFSDARLPSRDEGRPGGTGPTGVVGYANSHDFSSSLYGHPG